MKLVYIILSLLSLSTSVIAQKYMTRNGYIGFFSHTPVEDIKADNNQVASVLDISTGEIVFQVLIKSFHFPKALMEVHFNENYLESEKYPRSTFNGRITNISSVDLSKPGTYDVTVEGDLSIHNVTRKIAAGGTLIVAGDIIDANSKFIIAPEDYNIVIPAIVRNNIAKNIEVTVTLKYTPLKQ